MPDLATGPEPASPGQPRRGAARLRQIALAMLGGMAGLAVLVAIAIWSIWQSDAPIPWLLRQVPGLHAQGVSGSLAGGDIRIESLDWQQPLGGATLHADDLVLRGLSIQLRYQPRLSGTVSMRSAWARSVTYHRGPAPATPPAAPIDLGLPVALQIDQLSVRTLQVDQAPAVRDLTARVELGADQGALHRVDRLHAQIEQAKVTGAVQVGAHAPLSVAGLLQVGGGAGSPWSGQAEISQTLANLQLVVQVVGTPVADRPTPHLQAKATVQPWAAWPLGELKLSAQAFDLASLSAQWPVTAISGQAQVSSQGLNLPASAEVQLNNTQAGRLDLGRLPLRDLALSLTASPAQAWTSDKSGHPELTLRRFDLQFGDAVRSAGRATGSGQWRDGVLELAVVLSGVLPAQLDDRAAMVRLSGPLNLRWAATLPPALHAANAASAPAGATRDARSANPREGAGLPWQVSGRLEGQALSPQGKSLQLEFDAAAGPGQIVVRQARASAGSGHASISGNASRTTGVASQQGDPLAGWQVLCNAQFVDFDPLPWWRGASQSVWRAGRHRLDGQLQADLHWRAGLRASASSASPKATQGPAQTRTPEPAWLNQLEGWAQVNLAHSQLADMPLTGQARLERRDGVATLKAAIRSGPTTLDLTAQRESASMPHERATLAMASPDLAALAPLVRQVEAWLPGTTSALPRAGQLEARADMDNRADGLHSNGHLSAKNLRNAVGQIGSMDLIWTVGWAKLRDGTLHANNEPLLLNLKAAALARGEQRLDRLAFDVSGTLADHRLTMLVESPARPPGWTEVLFGPAGNGTRVELNGQGRWANPGAVAHRWLLSGLRFQAAGREAAASAGSGPDRSHGTPKPWLRAQDLGGEVDVAAHGIPTAVRLSPGRVEVLDTALRWSQASWWAGGQPDRPAQQLDLVAELETLDVASLLRRVQPGVGWSGNLTLGGRIDIHSGEQVSADLLLDRSGGDLQVTDDLGGVQPLGLTELRLSLGVHQGVWQFAQGLAGTQVGEMAGAQVVRTTPQQHWPPANAPLQGVIQARVAKLDVWGHWVPPGWRLSGALQTNASFGGTFGAPEYSGRMQGQALGLRNLLEGVALSDGELDLTLAGDRARIKRFSFRGGEGRLDLSGEATLGAAPSARLALVASRFRLLGRIDRRVVVSGQSRLQLDADQLKLDGRIAIDEGLIDWTQGEAPSLDSDVVVTARPQPLDAESRGRDEPRPLPAALRNAQVAVTIGLGERLRLRGRGLDTGLHGELRISSPGGRLSLDGTVKAVGGTYAAYGQRLEITRGDLTFTGTANNPRLDVLAIRPNLDVVVGVAIAGTALQPRIRLVSQPEMAELDKLSWLVLGRSPDGLGRTDTALLQRAAIALLAGEGKAPTDELLSKLGLTDFSVRQTDGDVRETIVSLGRQLSRRWYVGYERSLSATNGTWQLVYRIAQRFTLRAQSGVENALDLIWSWRWN